MRCPTSAFTTQSWTFDIKKASSIFLTEGRIMFFMRIPTLYFVLGTLYNSPSQPCYILFLDVGDLFFPFDLVPDILGRFDGDTVAGLH